MNVNCGFNACPIFVKFNICKTLMTLCLILTSIVLNLEIQDGGSLKPLKFKTWWNCRAISYLAFANITEFGSKIKRVSTLKTKMGAAQDNKP